MDITFFAIVITGVNFIIWIRAVVAVKKLRGDHREIVRKINIGVEADNRLAIALGEWLHTQGYLLDVQTGIVAMTRGFDKVGEKKVTSIKIIPRPDRTTSSLRVAKSAVKKLTKKTVKKVAKKVAKKSRV